MYPFLMILALLIPGNLRYEGPSYKKSSALESKYNGSEKRAIQRKKRYGLSYGHVDKVYIFTSHHFKECFNLLSI